MSKRGALELFPILALLIILTGCKTQKRTLDPSELRTKKTRELKNALAEQERSVKGYEGKWSVKASTKKKTKRFKVRVRAIHDSIFWASVSPALGVEVARLMMTRDSVKFIDRMNDRYFVGDHTYLRSKYNVPVNITDIHDLLLGVPLRFNRDRHHISSVDSLGYRITSVQRASLLKATGLGEGSGDPASSVDSVLGIKVQREAWMDRTRKDPPEAQRVHRYWLDTANLQVIRSLISDPTHPWSIRSSYQDRSSVKGLELPKIVRIQAISPKTDTKLRFIRRNFSLERADNFPFSIPSDYQRIQ